MASPSVTHDDLDKAAAAAEERQSTANDNEDETPALDLAGSEGDDDETPAAAAEGEDDKSEPTDNAERTRLGRKVAAMGQQLSDITNLLTQLTASGTQDTTNDDDTDSEQFISVKDLPKYLDQINSNKSKANQRYQSDYVRTVTKLGVDNDDHDAIFAEMMENHNVRHSDNATMDAMLNYERAKNSLISKGGKLPLKGDKIKGGGVDTGGAVVAKSKTIKLSPAAQELLGRIRSRDSSWTDEKVAKTLGKPKPHLTR